MTKIKWIRKLNRIPQSDPQIIIGNDSQIHSTTRLGENGYTMAIDEAGNWLRGKQHGGILIGDKVHIGEFCTIKRATLPNTYTQIGYDSKICSFVNIGHNCKIGKHVFVGPGVVLNGSVEVGDNTWIGGNAVIRQHIKIGKNAVVGQGAVVIKDIPTEITVVGNPAIQIDYLHNVIHPSFKHGQGFQIGVFNHIHEDVEVGGNVQIRSHVELRPKTKIGNSCYIDSGVKSSGLNEIGNNVILRYDTIIARNVIIEDGVFISPQVMFINVPFFEKEKKKTIIRRGAKIGTNATINDGVKIGEGVIIGAKSFVNKDCLEPGVYVGIPVRKIK